MFSVIEMESIMTPYERVKEWRRVNPERRRAQARKDAAVAYDRDPEKFRARSRAYRAALSPEEKAARYEYDRQWERRNRVSHLFYNARNRARKRGLPFDIEKSDIVIPEVCPVLGIALAFSPGPGGRGFGDTSPSVDRMVPELGYVRGNIRVISYRANSLKKDATVAELEAVLSYMRGER